MDSHPQILTAMINLHLSYKEPECINMQDGTVLVYEGQNQEQDPLDLANGYAGPDLDHIVVIDPDRDDQLFLLMN